MRPVLAVACLLSLAACAESDPDSGLVVAKPTTPAANVYAGPLYVPVEHPDAPNVLARSGAAGQALECDGEPYLGSTGRNWGAPSGGGEPAEGLQLFVDDITTDLPRSGYRVERREGERVLYSYDVGGETKVAVVVRDGLAYGGADPGCGMESYAQCNPAEFGPADDEELVQQVWTDRSGQRVPTTVVVSYPGPAHCGWQSATFLILDDDTQYVRDPRGVLEGARLRASYAADVALPEDARDTGYRLGDQQLWLARDKSAAYVVTSGGTERWPAAAELIVCA